MPLTPADVHNVAFSKPPIGKRGYNEDEVDAFLDLVEQELARLIEENSDLRQRVGELDTELTEAKSAPRASSAAPVAAEPAPASVVTPVVAAPAPSAAAVEDHNVRAAKILGLAQDTADRLTGKAKEDSERLLAESKTSAEKQLAEARQRSETLLADAQTRSEAQLRQAQEKADALQADAERKHTEIMGTINQQRTVLEGRIEQLRTFEREYRTRLKTYLESQLEELGQRGSAAPAEGAATSEGLVQDATKSGSTSPFSKGNS
ncbi:MAG: DivIVA-like cell division protein Wag31 [Mycobacteriaceae bacterium]